MYCMKCLSQNSFSMNSDNPILFGKVMDGQVFLEDLDLYHSLVSELEGERIQLTVDQMKLSKTEKQINTYFGIIIRKYMMQSEQFRGWTPKECDDYLGYKFRMDVKQIRRLKTATVQTVEYIIPLSKLSRKAMSEYINQVILYLQEELGIEEIIIDEQRNKN